MNTSGGNQFGHGFFDNTSVLALDRITSPLTFENNTTTDGNDGIGNDNNNDNNMIGQYGGYPNDRADYEEGDIGTAMTSLSDVNKMDILQHLINTLNGKDKLAKTLKYSLDLINYLLTIESSILKRNKYIRSLTQTVIKKVMNQLSFISLQLTTYRYILRFGNSPFLIAKFIQKCKNIIKFGPSQSIGKLINHLVLKLCNENSFKEMLNIYFSVCDEAMLLNRFHVWSNQKIEKIISRHGVYSWQLDIMLNLKDNLLELQQLRRKSLEYNIEKNIREVDNNLYPNRQRFNNNNYSSPNLDSNTNNNIHQSFMDILDDKLIINSQRQHVVKLDITRLLFDLLANSTDFFKLKVSAGTYCSLSLGSSCISLIKLWLQTRQEISKEKTS